MAARTGMARSQSLMYWRKALCDFSSTRRSVVKTLLGRNIASSPRALAARLRTVAKSQVKNWLNSAGLPLPLICPKYGRNWSARQMLSGKSDGLVFLPSQSSCCTFENALRFLILLRLRPKSSFESSVGLNCPFTWAWSTADFM
jgi:hypothetical protein